MSHNSGIRRRISSRMPRGREQLRRSLEDLRVAVGRCNAIMLRGQDGIGLGDAEFRVFSQWGEDGIIQYLVHSIPIQRDTFVEIGVEDYTECNTRFLLVNDNWDGLIVDSGTAHLETLSTTGLRWRHKIEGVSQWVSRDNVDNILESAGVTGDIGLLSLDIDGSDYWVLDAVSVISPRIIVAEYNSSFGPRPAVTVPYRADFDRTQAHYSWLYYGASLAALDFTLERKGYRLVGSNSAGCNAFWVRNDVAGDLPDLSPEEAYVKSRIREARSESGDLSYVDSHEEGMRLVAELPLWDVVNERSLTVREALG